MLALQAVPDGNPMPPPELATDTPVSDILQPVEVNPTETLRDYFYISVGHCGVSFPGDAVRFVVAAQIYEPLKTNQGFNH